MKLDHTDTNISRLAVNCAICNPSPNTGASIHIPFPPTRNTGQKYLPSPLTQSHHTHTLYKTCLQNSMKPKEKCENQKDIYHSPHETQSDRRPRLELSKPLTSTDRRNDTKQLKRTSLDAPRILITHKVPGQRGFQSCDPLVQDDRTVVKQSSELSHMSQLSQGEQL